MTSNDTTVLQFAIRQIIGTFATINVMSSILICIWPLAIPIFLAEFCLLSVWSAWGPGGFVRRLGYCVSVGTILILTQGYLIAIGFLAGHGRLFVLQIVLLILSCWVLSQVPLWLLRYFWQWRISGSGSSDREPFSIRDVMLGTALIALALGSANLAFELAQGEPGGLGIAWFENQISFGVFLLSIALAIGTMILSIYFANALKFAPMRLLILGAVGLVLSVSVSMFVATPPERWIFAGIMWFWLLIFQVSILIPLEFIRQHGLRLYIGSSAIGS